MFIDIYIYQNPLRAALSNRVCDYPYSTFHGKAGYSKLEIPIYTHPFHDDLDLGDICAEEEWLNTLLPDDQLNLIRKGIRRFTFNLSLKDAGKLKPFMAKR
jgi:hypothetical protein